MLEANERPAFPDAKDFNDASTGKSVTRRELVSRVKLPQRRITWLQKLVAAEQALQVTRGQALAEAMQDREDLRAELKANNEWGDDTSTPRARVAEWHLCEDMIKAARQAINDGQNAFSTASNALSLARIDLEAQVKEAKSWGGLRWNVLKEAEES